MNTSNLSADITAELTVAAIVPRDGRYLMVEELVRGRKVFNQPAGHVEVGETLQAASVRETWEETAWKFSPEAITGVYLWNGTKNRPCIMRTVFCGDCNSHDPEQRLDDGIIAAHWLSYAQIAAQPERLRSPLVLRALDDYRAGQRYPLELIHQVGAAHTA